MDVQSVSRTSVTTQPQVSMRRRVLGQGKLGTLIRTLAVFLVTGIFFFPIFFWFLASLKPFGLIFQLPPVIIFTPTFNWYRVVLGFISFNDLMVKLTGALAGTGGGFYFSLPYIVTSLIVGLSSTAVVILVSTPAAYSLSRFYFKHRQDLTFWILSTRMMPPIVAALPLFFMYRQANLIDTYPGVILVHTVINIPLAVLLLKSFFDEVPYDLDEAAMVDGATRWQAFTKVIIHYILPGLAATAILSFIFSWNEMLLTLTLSRTTVRTMPVAASMFDTSTGGTEWGALAAFGTMAMIPVFIFVLFVQRNLVRGLTMGAVKG